MGYIFEAEIESIIRAVRLKTIGEQESISLKKILSSDVHPSIKAYFKSEVEKILEEERRKEYRSKKFPYNLPEVISLQEQIDLLLIYNYEFDIQEFNSVLNDAVHFEFNYLCRPQWTLLNFIMENKRSVSTSIVERKLKYTVDYTYFPELIKGYIVEHGLAEITYDELKSLLKRIDDEVVARHSSYELAQMTRALFEFVESGKIVPQMEFEKHTLPINAAIVFFEDKDLKDIKSKLEYERDHNRIVQLTVDQLADIIRGVGAETEQKISPEPCEEKPQVLAESSIENGEKSVDLPDEKLIIKTESVVQDKEIAKESIEKIESEEIQPEKNEGIDTMKSYEKPKQDLYLTSEELLKLFNEKETKKIIKKLFKKDENAFHGAMIEISLLESWEDVAHYLDALFTTNGVDPFSEEAILFTDRLSEFFNSTKAVG